MKASEEKKELNGEKTVVKDAPIQKKIVESAHEENNIGTWKSVLVGGVPGIIIGVAGTLATENAYASAIEEEIQDDTLEDGGSTLVHDVAPVAEGVNKDMSFSEAFAAARSEVGPGGVFSWHGQIYSTYYKPEWDAMDNEQRNEYSQSVVQANVHPESYTPQDSDPPIVDDDSNHEVEVEIIGVSQLEDGNGDVHDVGIGTVDGHDAAFFDLEGDGEVDMVVIDENDNGEVEDHEIYDARGAGITMDDIVTQSEFGGVAPDDGLYDDMPDYTNDADTSSLA